MVQVSSFETHLKLATAEGILEAFKSDMASIPIAIPNAFQVRVLVLVPRQFLESISLQPNLLDELRSSRIDLLLLTLSAQAGRRAEREHLCRVRLADHLGQLGPSRLDPLFARCNVLSISDGSEALFRLDSDLPGAERASQINCRVISFLTRLYDLRRLLGQSSLLVLIIEMVELVRHLLCPA